MARLRALLISICLVCVFAMPLPAFAASATQLKAQLDALKADTREAGAAFDRAYWELDETEVRITRTDKKIASTQRKLRKAQKRLSSHAASIYRRGDYTFIEFMMGASSFDDLVTRLDYMRRVNASDAQAVMDVKGTRNVLRSQRAALVKERKSSARALASLKSERDRLEARLKSKQAEFLKVKAQLDAMRGGANRPDGQMAVPGPNGMVFPVVGSYYYSNTWGASRSGGRRRHQGTDVMAPRGTPIVAIMSGRVTSKYGGLGGKTTRLYGSNGWQFYYAHLDGWAVRSGRVKAGQVIGYVGSTGNASGGAPHLHLQIEPRGYPVNPYPYLRAME
ncbi:MAG: peptidoglycan DD-metalloendopeptidase family protein [Coriobacteriia bacterium]|nr:peptidoglycan DD-metalloendopeptidase family protein [Coriobacteriia bacterium]